MNKISFVYFDVGGVIVKDFSETDHWKRLKLSLGVTAQTETQFDALYDKLEEQMCKGVIETELLPEITKQLGISIPSNFSFNQYIVDRFLPNPGIYPLINQVREKTRIGLLTDMYQGMRKLMLSRNLFPDIEWEIIIDSSEVGVKKPMPEIYQLAQARAGVPAGEILFIDNRQKNLDGAKNAGWQTFLYNSSDYDQANLQLSGFISQNLR